MDVIDHCATYWEWLVSSVFKSAFKLFFIYTLGKYCPNKKINTLVYQISRSAKPIRQKILLPTIFQAPALNYRPRWSYASCARRFLFQRARGTETKIERYVYCAPWKRKNTYELKRPTRRAFVFVARARVCVTHPSSRMGKKGGDEMVVMYVNGSGMIIWCIAVFNCNGKWIEILFSFDARTFNTHFIIHFYVMRDIQIRQNRSLLLLLTANTPI